MFQDSIKKCVKLVTTDLQKATSDISSISPGSSSMIQPKQSQKLQKSPASRQLFPSTSPIGGGRGLLQTGSKSKGISPVSNSFLKGISLMKTSNLPTVTPAIPTKPPPSAPVPISAQQILAQQRLSSELSPHAVVRVTKNTSNDPVIIDVEAAPSSSSGLQLTQPRSVPPQVQPPVRPQPSLQLVSNPKPVLTVGQSNASALKSLVNKINKRPVLSIAKKSIGTPLHKKSLEVVVIDGATPPKPSSAYSPNIVTSAAPPRKLLAPTLTSPIATPTPNAYPFDPSSVSLPSTISPVLSTLGLQPSGKSPYYSTASTAGVATQGQTSISSSTTIASTTTTSTRNEEAPTEASKEPDAKVKDEDTSSEVSLQISCVQCEPDEDKYKIPSHEQEENVPPENNVIPAEEPDKSQSEQSPSKAVKPPGEAANVSSDTDFPSQIFAEESPKESEPFKSPTTSVSDMLHAATDALLERS